MRVLPSRTARFSSKLQAPRLAQLPGNLALAHVLDVIDMRGDGGHDELRLAGRDERGEPIGEFLGDEAGRQLPRAPARVLHQRGKEGDVVADAVDDEGVERVGLRLDRADPIAGVGHQLGDHRIVMHRDFAALVDAGVVAHRDPLDVSLGRRAVFDQPPGRRQEAARRVLGVDAALDRPALELHVGLGQAQRLATGAADHLLDEVDAGDELGHGMLDLKPRVHLQEVEAAVLPGDEFDRAGRIVVHRPGERDRLLAHLAPRFLVEERRGRLLDHFLVAALDRAFALAEIDDIAVLVAEHLDFDVAGIDDEFLDEDAIVAERRQGLGLGAREAFRDFLRGYARCACPCRRRPPRP